MRRWDGLVEKYLALQETRGLSAETVRHRERELHRLGTWLKTRRPRPSLEGIEAEQLAAYVQGRGAFHSRSMVAGVTSVLRSMGEFLVSEGVWRSNPLRWMRGPKMDARRRVPRRIGIEQQRALWAAAEGRRQGHARHQAICALAILYGTGLRRGELARLDVDDWNGESRTLRIDGKKTGVERCVPVPDAVYRCIEAYLPHRHNRLELRGKLQERALLINTQGGRLGGDGSARLVARLCRDAGLPTVTMHQFRHSCASDLLEAGVSLPDVQRVLGHATVVSTLRYVAVADPERARAVGKHPINGFLGVLERERRAS